MPLQDHTPIIDDRRYRDILQEARSRIPRYTPEWTDLNENDPGIIMLELFAWLTEMQLFRLARVPELNYLKFLELIGVELEPAKAATGQLRFPVSKSHPEPTLIVPAKTQVATEEPDDQGPILFEIDQALVAMRAALVSLQADEGANFRNLTVENQDTQAPFRPFGPNAVRDNALMLGFDEELPEATIRLAFWTPVISGETLSIGCFAQTPRYSSTRLAWEYWDGRQWRALTVLADRTLAFSVSGELVLTGPPSGSMVAESLGAVDEARFWIRARIDAAGYEGVPELLAVRTNCVTATQAETIEFETLGGSNGEVEQVLRLRAAPVLAESLSLRVQEDAEYEPWQEVADFLGSGPQDPHYVLNRTTGEVRFGDGERGRVPVANPRNRANIQALIYQAGGGQRGNLPADKLTVLQSSIRGLDANAVTNPFATAGGTDEETLEQARKRAPQSLKSRERAVTDEDFEELARRAANIARAKALPLHHPQFPGVDVPGVVSVVVIPDLKDDPAPVPSQGTLQSVCAYLDQRRLMTTELYVIGPRYRTVQIETELVAQDSADLAELKAAALDNLALYFHPLHGGEDSDPAAEREEDRWGTGWPFGGDLFYSLLYRRLLAAGVRRIKTLTIRLDGEAYPACQDVPLEDGYLLTSGEHQVQVDYEVLP